jgi:hypothetical protein
MTDQAPTPHQWLFDASVGQHPLPGAGFGVYGRCAVLLGGRLTGSASGNPFVAKSSHMRVEVRTSAPVAGVTEADFEDFVWVAWAGVLGAVLLVRGGMDR